jgi:DNA repair protein RadA/Sms
VSEAARLGFKTAIVPKGSVSERHRIEVVEVETIIDAKQAAARTWARRG